MTASRAPLLLLAAYAAALLALAALTFTRRDLAAA
jgi:hypothetical protein